MGEYKQYLRFVIFVMIIIATLLIILLASKKVSKKIKERKYKKIEEREIERNRLADIVFAQSSTVSTEMLRKIFYSTIYNYIIVENDVTVPITSSIVNEVSETLISMLYEQRQRFAESGYSQKVTKFVLNKHLYIMQQNDNGFKNSRVLARARYEITIDKNHSTFHTIDTYKKETYYIFEKTENTNWKLIKIKDDKIIEHNSENQKTLRE